MQPINVLVKKTGRVVALDPATLPANSVQFLFHYGATQKINDSHASVIKKDWKGTDAEFVAAVDREVDACIESLRNGTLRVAAVEDPDVVMRRQLASYGMTEAQIDAMLAKTPKGSTKRAA